jgi:hypothetical protein
MAIIYTYPSESVVTGTEELLVTLPGDSFAIRTISLQQVANLKASTPGGNVDRILFSDSIGLTPTQTAGGADPSVGTGTILVGGTVSGVGGGTGKDTTALNAANVGDVLKVNATKTGYDFGIAGSSGDTYTISTKQNTSVSTSVDLDLTDSSSTVQTITLIPSGSTSLTANNAAGTITINSSGSGGSSYQAGNGIEFNTATVPDTISADLGAGLSFDASDQIAVALNTTIMGGAVASQNGLVLTSNSGSSTGASWSAASSYNGSELGAGGVLVGAGSGATANDSSTNKVDNGIVIPRLSDSEIGDPVAGMVIFDSSEIGSDCSGMLVYTGSSWVCLKSQSI